MKCKRAYATKRKLWLSPGFRLEFPQIAGQVARDIGARGARMNWRLLASVEEFVAHKQHAEQQRTTAQVIAAVSQAEAAQWHDVKYVMGPGAFLDFVDNLDMEQSQQGMCGR